MIQTAKHALVAAVSVAALMAPTAGFARDQDGSATTPYPSVPPSTSSSVERTSEAAPANSQSPPATPEASSQPGEIVVTAQRRAERLQDVPISIAVVSGATLQDRNIQNFEQLAPLVPNLTIAQSPAANVIVLRGIGSSPGSPSLDQSVVMFIDGIYSGNARQFAVPFLDIERMEILRGPQGALVGRNTSAGAINIITRKPGKEFGGYLDATYDFKRNGPVVEGGVDVPVTSSFAIRVVGRYLDQDGYIRNTVDRKTEPRRREAVGRVTGVFDDGGPVKITAKYEHGYNQEHGSEIQAIAPAAGEPFDYQKDTALTTGPEYNNIKTDNAAVQFDIDLGGPRLVSISGFSGFVAKQLIDSDFFYRNLAYSYFGQTLNQFSQEVRLVSPSGQKLEYTGGIYYSVAKLLEQRTTGLVFAPPASSYRIFRQDEEAISPYGSLTYHLTDKLRVNGSLRFTQDNKDASFESFSGPQAATLFSGVQTASFPGRLSKGTLDPSGSIQYDLTRNAMIYASYGRGSKSGGFQGAVSNATPQTFAFRPERSTSYEGGIKLTIPRVGYFNVSGFYTDYRDLQVSTALPSPDGKTAPFFTANAPKARTVGAEAELFLKLTSFFELSGSLAWLPTAKYVDFTRGPCYVGRTPDGTAVGSCDQSGERLGYAPRYSGSLTATFTQAVTDDLTFHASASPIFRSKAFTDFADDPQTAQSAFAKLDARLSISGPEEHWEVAVVGQNLTNKRTISFSSAGAFANTFLSPTARIGVIDPPRIISVQARVKF